MDESRGGSRIVYSKLSATLTEADLASQFKIVSEETDWAGTTFSYNVLSRPTSSTVSSATTPFLYDGWNPITMGVNFMLAGPGLDDIQAMVSSDSATNFLRDGVSSTVAFSNAAGVLQPEPTRDQTLDAQEASRARSLPHFLSRSPMHSRSTSSTMSTSV